MIPKVNSKSLLELSAECLTNSDNLYHNASKKKLTVEEVKYANEKLEEWAELLGIETKKTSIFERLKKKIKRK